MDDQRRKLCQAAGLALGSVLVPACGSGVGCDEPGTCSGTSLSTGVRASDLAPGSATMRMTAQAQVFLCRDANGIYAVDAGCTHLGCNVSFAGAQLGFVCPCHGATYDFNGNHPTRPAPSPLVHYAMCVSPSGVLVVDTNTIVDACVRLKA